MPSLTVPIGPDGPIVIVWVGISEPRLEALKKAGQPVPQIIPVRALLDTGASCTAVCTSVINRLGIPPTGTTPILTPSTGSVPSMLRQFDVALGIHVDNQPIHVASLMIPVIECDFQLQTIDALIGRDVLARGILIYNGPQDSVTWNL